MTDTLEGFVSVPLDDRHLLHVGRLPDSLLMSASDFEALWRIHPAEYHRIKIHGKVQKTPRWQQAYGRDYHYTGQTNAALETPPALVPFLDWARSTLDGRLNGLLLNWYDGSLGHYIGAHKDSRVNMIEGAPIVTISLGEERIFRLSRPEDKKKHDFPARDGTVFVMPYATNLAWKHGVPRFVRHQGRRISITLRAFQEIQASDGKESVGREF